MLILCHVAQQPGYSETYFVACNTLFLSSNVNLLQTLAAQAKLPNMVMHTVTVVYVLCAFVNCGSGSIL